jgi:hypothetical protein
MLAFAELCQTSCAGPGFDPAILTDAEVEVVARRAPGEMADFGVRHQVLRSDLLRYSPAPHQRSPARW